MTEARLRAMKAAHEMLVKAVERAINEADPIGLLELGAPSDEYAPEIGTIIPRLVNARDVDEVTAVLHEEFVRWFGSDTAGPRQPYEAPGRQIWRALLEFREGVGFQKLGTLF